MKRLLRTKFAKVDENTPDMYHLFIMEYAYGNDMDKIKLEQGVDCYIYAMKNCLKNLLKARSDLDLIFKSYLNGLINMSTYFKTHFKKIVFGVVYNIWTVAGRTGMIYN